MWGLSGISVGKKECWCDLEAEREEGSQGGKDGDSGKAKMGPKEASHTTLWAIAGSNVDTDFFLVLCGCSGVDGLAVGKSAGKEN